MLVYKTKNKGGILKKNILHLPSLPFLQNKLWVNTATSMLKFESREKDGSDKSGVRNSTAMTVLTLHSYLQVITSVCAKEGLLNKWAEWDLNGTATSCTPSRVLINSYHKNKQPKIHSELILYFWIRSVVKGQWLQSTVNHVDLIVAAKYAFKGILPSLQIANVNQNISTEY